MSDLMKVFKNKDEVSVSFFKIKRKDKTLNKWLLGFSFMNTQIKTIFGFTARLYLDSFELNIQVYKYSFWIFINESDYDDVLGW